MTDRVKHISIDSQPTPVVDFVLSLEPGVESVLELGGKELLRVSPIATVDRERLKQAILARRDESRALNAEWEHADRETWESEPPPST
jgi:hypothetical protein